MRYVNSSHFTESDIDGAPTKSNPGGGVHSKLWNIKRVFPSMEISTELGEGINLIDPLWLNMFNTPESLQEKTKAIKDINAINILWQEELSIFRFIDSSQRFKLIEAVDHILNCNQYLLEMMRAYIDKPMHVLYTPIDSDFFKPAKTKRPQIMATSRIWTQKNVEGVYEFFKALPNNIDKVFVGSCDMWGESVKKYETYPQDVITQKKIKDVCEWHPALDKEEIAEIFSESWGYLNMSRCDVGCLSFLEAAMSGCHCFCWHSHPMFDEYAFVNRFHGIKDGVEAVMNKLKQQPNANTSIRNFMISKHGYEAVQSQMESLLKEVLL